MFSSWRIVAIILLISMSVPVSAQEPSGCYFTVINFPRRVDFATDIQPIFDSKCASCHQPSSADFAEHRLDLRQGRAFSELVGVPSTLNPALDRVRPYSFSGSLLWSKVHCAEPQAGDPMPPAGLQLLTQNEQQSIYGWIVRGAPPSDLDEVESVPIQPGLSGPWADRSAAAQGFTIEVVERGEVHGSQAAPPSQLVALWFTYNTDDPSVELDPGRQRWLMIDATYAKGARRADGLVLLFDEGLFDDISPNRSKVIGTASIVFSSCFDAYLSYDIHFDGNPELRRASTITLRRLTPAPFCIPETEQAAR